MVCHRIKLVYDPVEVAGDHLFNGKSAFLIDNQGRVTIRYHLDSIAAQLGQQLAEGRRMIQIIV